jgi:phosphatidylinositol-binding clathrin assembly protein
MRRLIEFGTLGHPLSENLSSYAAYLECRIRAYRDLRHDTVKVQNENNREERLSGGEGRGAGTSRSRTINGKKLRQMTVEKGLLRETKIVQRQIDALLQCKVMSLLHGCSPDLTSP